MSAKHTPGPLKASKGWDGDPERWVVVTEGKIRYHIATIENGQPGDTCQTEGYTARLFAAAPELLEAAELQNHAEEWRSNECPNAEEHGEDEPELCSHCFPHFDRARLARLNAMAKAKGGTGK